MALNKANLAAGLKAAFEAGMEDPDWTLDQAAAAMADAIDLYVRGAAVIGVTVDVIDAGSIKIGTGAQTGTGSLN
jgi:hypothetical protein